MPRSRYWLWMIPLMLLAFWLGLRMLDVDLLWHDEARALYYAADEGRVAHSPVDIIQRLAHHKWQAPAYYLLLNLWGRVAGWLDFVTRSISLLIGLVAIAWMYRLGRDLFSPRIGVWSAAILVGSSIYVHYLHELRPYTAFVLFTCSSVWAYWKLLAPDKSPATWLYIVLFLSLTTMGYTHSLALLTMVGIGAYHFILAPKGTRWLWISAAILLAALAILPWVLVTYNGIAEDAVRDANRQHIAMFGLQIVDVLLIAFSNHNVLLVVLLCGLAVFDKRPATRLVIVWTLVSIGTSIVISQIVPAFIHVRYLMALWPALALLTVVGIDDLARRGIPAVAVIGLWMLLGAWTSRNSDFFNSLPNSVASLPRAGFMQMVKVLSESAHAEDTIVLHTSPLGEEWNSQLLHIYYIYNNTPAQYTNMEMVTPYTVEVDEALYMQAVSDYLSGVPVVWTGVVPQVPQTFRSDAFFRQLQRTHAECQRILNRADIQFNLYAQPTYPPMAVFDDAAVQAELLWTLPAQVTTQLDILLGWHRIPDLPPDTYSVGIHLMNSAGELVKQVDYGLSNDGFSCRWSPIQVDDLPPGDYDLYLLVYDYRSGERLPDDAHSADNRARIARVTVAPHNRSG